MCARGVGRVRASRLHPSCALALSDFAFLIIIKCVSRIVSRVVSLSVPLAVPHTCRKCPCAGRFAVPLSVPLRDAVGTRSGHGGDAVGARSAAGGRGDDLALTAATGGTLARVAGSSWLLVLAVALLVSGRGASSSSAAAGPCSCRRRRLQPPGGYRAPSVISRGSFFGVVSAFSRLSLFVGARTPQGAAPAAVAIARVPVCPAAAAAPRPAARCSQQALTASYSQPHAQECPRRRR